MSFSELTTIASLFIAFAAVVVGPAVQVRLARARAVRERRQVWIETFRAEVSRFLAALMTGEDEAENGSALPALQTTRHHLFALFVMLDEKEPAHAALSAHLRGFDPDAGADTAHFVAETVRLSQAIIAAEEARHQKARG